MSTATLEAPATEAAPELPDLSNAFGEAMKALEAKEGPLAPEPTPKKEALKEEAKKEPAKEAPKDEKKPEPVETKPAKKLSALDAALADEPAPEVDEVTKLSEQPESKDNWSKARETMRRMSEEIKGYKEASKKAAEPAPEHAARLKEMQAQLDQYRTENEKMRDNIMALDVRLDPATQQKLQARETSVARIAQFVKEAGGNPDSFLSAMALPLHKRGPALDSLLEDITSGRAKATIEQRLAQVDIVDEELEGLMSQPHKSFDELQRQRQIEASQQAEKLEQFKQSTFEAVRASLPKLSKLMRASAADAEGADAFNATLNADLDNAPKLLAVGPQEAAIAAFKAARYDSVEKMFLEHRAESSKRITELEEALARYEGTEPGFRGGGKPKEKADYERPLADVFHEAWKNG